MFFFCLSLVELRYAHYERSLTGLQCLDLEYRVFQELAL